MNTAKAELNNYRQAPRKVRLIAGLVRGKRVPAAVAALQFAGKKAAMPIQKLIQSAVSNAKAQGLNIEDLVVSKITVDAGKTLFRTLPMAHGRAFRMRKRTSQVLVELSEVPAKPVSKRSKTAQRKLDASEALVAKSGASETKAKASKK